MRRLPPWRVIVFLSQRSLRSSPYPDLLSVQHDSFGWFLESGLKQIFDGVSPIEDFTGNLALELTEHRFGDPTVDASKKPRNRTRTTRSLLFVTARFLNKQTGEIKEQQVFLGDFPIMTPNGTFIINGTERVVVSQLVRSPGVYFDQSIDKLSDRDVYAAKVIPGRGAWLEFDIDKKDTVGVRVDRKRRQYVTTFLRALGFAETRRGSACAVRRFPADRRTPSRRTRRPPGTKRCSTSIASCVPVSSPRSNRPRASSTRSSTTQSGTT